jgi:hypothetical protein
LENDSKRRGDCDHEKAKEGTMRREKDEEQVGGLNEKGGRKGKDRRNNSGKENSRKE